MKTESSKTHQDEILAGIHAARAEHAAALNYDIHAICAESRHEEQKLAAAGRKIVSFVRNQTSNPQPA